METFDAGHTMGIGEAMRMDGIFPDLVRDRLLQGGCLTVRRGVPDLIRDLLEFCRVGDFERPRVEPGVRCI